MTQHDTLLRFIFKNTPVKGASVRLTTAWKAMRQYQKMAVKCYATDGRNDRGVTAFGQFPEV